VSALRNSFRNRGTWSNDGRYHAGDGGRIAPTAAASGPAIAGLASAATASAWNQMDVGHCTPGRSAGRRACPSQRERKRIRLLFEGEHQPAHSVAARVCSAGSASGASTHVQEIRATDFTFDYRGTASG